MILVDEAWPVCAPGYAAAHAETLAGPVSGWGGLTLLDLVRPNEGWASWENLFAAAGGPEETPRRFAFDSYVYVLEAAVASHGVALDWPRFADRLLEAGTLVAPRDVSMAFG